MSARLREIETMLVDEFRDAGSHVFQIRGDWFATVRDAETSEASATINITKLAEQILARFP
jgi:hypothetical protein